MSAIEVKVPDIGDFKDVPVIEILVKAGDTIAKEQSLITVESDKSTMEIPAPEDGVVKELKVKLGDVVNTGSLILVMESSGAAAAPAAPAKPAPAAAQAPAPAAPAPAPAAAKPASAPAAAGPVPQGDVHAEVLVLGSGPGGYTAAFRAADLGKNVVMVERYASLGGVCLNVGCIPSKALLHAAKVITEAEEMEHSGISFGKPKVDINALRAWKDGVVGKLTKGIGGMARGRKVTVVEGVGKFTSPNMLTVKTKDGEKKVSFDSCIIAAGSQVAKIPGFPCDDKRLVDSTGALELADVPKRLLVIGGGIIGLEMACVYDALGSKVTVVEFADGLIPAADRDLVKILQKRIEKRYEAIYLKAKVTKIEAKAEGLLATFEGAEGSNAPQPAQQMFDRVLLAVGRRPNGKDIAAEAAGVTVNERGYIPVDKQQRTGVPHIYAIGDICGEPMLAHKATHEAHVAAETIAGHKAAFDAMTIPSVAYTDPEVAWMGLTETQAKKDGIEHAVAVFPWAASGRAISVGRADGLTKLIYEPKSQRILGAGIVGVNAGELIAEMTLALEMGADLEDVALTVHPHPTLSETPFFAAEVGLGTITDMPPVKKPA
ncbi:MAG TPA: dihydrolipoyl dehydrogenase [Burkholderiales bacterium]|nr:dihydrolipoyl dehydrogenase [Burkholderiales bacterium]